MHITLILIALWLSANLFHYAWVQLRRLFWERRLSRDAAGLLPLAASFTVGKGPIALLFIHGFADTPRIWQRMADRLAATGDFTCRALRLPGSAEPASQARKQSLDLWRQALDDELNRLRKSHAHVWLIGHSLGGALALDAILRRPPVADGLAVFAPMIDVSSQRSPVLPPAAWFCLASFALSLSPTFESCFSADGVAVDDPSFRYTRDRFIPFSVYRSLFKLIRANRRQAGAITCPVFAATSERDSIVDTPAAQRWLSQCRGTKRLRACTDIGHVIPLENGWQTLTDDLASFIREQTPLQSSRFSRFLHIS